MEIFRFNFYVQNYVHGKLLLCTALYKERGSFFSYMYSIISALLVVDFISRLLLVDFIFFFATFIEICVKNQYTMNVALYSISLAMNLSFHQYFTVLITVSL